MRRLLPSFVRKIGGKGSNSEQEFFLGSLLTVPTFLLDGTIQTNAMILETNKRNAQPQDRGEYNIILIQNQERCRENVTRDT